MGEEDSSWSSVGSGYSECPTEESTLKEMQMELTKKDELLLSLQDQLAYVKQDLKTVKEDKESAVKLLQAALRTETLLDKLGGDSISDVERDIIETIGTLVAGSEVLGVAELKEKAVKFGSAVLERKPSLAGAVLVACDSIALDYSALEECALEKLRLNPQDILACGNTLSVLSASGVEKVLKDGKMETNEFTMFEILKAWTKSAGANPKEEETLQERRSIACKLVDHIALDLIDPTLLVSTVRDSGIVTDAQLVDAFAKQAPLVKDQIAYQTKRSGPANKSTKCTWNKSKTELHSQPSGNVNMDTVVGRVMKTGTHKWSLRVEKDNSGCVCLGIAPASSKNVLRRTSDYLGLQPGQWSLWGSSKLWYQNGGIKSKNLGDRMKYKENSTVSFTLSLGPLNSLEASVDDGTPEILFKGPVFQHDGSGFVPAASIYGEGSIRFLGFEE